MRTFGPLASPVTKPSNLPFDRMREFSGDVPAVDVEPGARGVRARRQQHLHQRLAAGDEVGAVREHNDPDQVLGWDRVRMALCESRRGQERATHGAARQYRRHHKRQQTWLSQLFLPRSGSGALAAPLRLPSDGPVRAEKQDRTTRIHTDIRQFGVSSVWRRVSRRSPTERPAAAAGGATASPRGCPRECPWPARG